MLTVLTSDSIPWKRPSQVGSYFVANPKGTLTPSPKLHFGLRSMAKNALGTKAASPASPPVPPSEVCPRAVALALSENCVEGAITELPIKKCLPLGRRAMPAGFHHTVLASSAVAAAPAYALPSPLAPCS